MVAMGKKRRLPKKLPKATERFFPNLTEYVVTSPTDPSYNCVAFAAGDIANGDLEAGHRKVALYALSQDDWLHAAIQEENGEWSSKLGASYDIRHKSPQCVEGALYGKVVCFMKQPVDVAAPRGG
jgi:hypothetical protein